MVIHRPSARHLLATLLLLLLHRQVFLIHLIFWSLFSCFLCLCFLCIFCDPFWGFSQQFYYQGFNVCIGFVEFSPSLTLYFFLVRSFTIIGVTILSYKIVNLCLFILQEGTPQTHDLCLCHCRYCSKNLLLGCLHGHTTHISGLGVQIIVECYS
jgi:hypothetical protein